MDLCFYTNNAGKLAEIRTLLSDTNTIFWAFKDLL